MKQQLEKLISDRNWLSDSEAKEVSEFIKVYEFGLAYETLCDIIFEEKKEISMETYNSLVKLGKQMTLEETN